MARKKNYIEMHWTPNEGVFFVAERFSKTLKKKKYMTSVSKNVCINKLNDIVNRYNNIYENTIKNEAFW